MTEEQIATAKAILSEENLKSLGFKNIGETADRYFGVGYQYKDFHNIRIVSFMGIRTLELYFYGNDFLSRKLLQEENLTDTYKTYCIYDTVNRDDAVHHSNEELVAICEKWADAIKKAGVKEAKRLETYYNNLKI